MTSPRVVVLGGGFGELEAAFYLRYKLGARVELALVSDRDHFLFKPNTIYIPFGADPESLKVPLPLAASSALHSSPEGSLPAASSPAPRR